MLLLDKYESFKPFNENEAWGLFRIAALTEALGWSLLIIGIALKRYFLHGNDIPVQIAGRLHGTFFLIYFASAVIFYPSQSWSRKRTFVALLASVPPFGSLVFEQWAAKKRQVKHIRRKTLNYIYFGLTNRAERKDTALTNLS